MEGVRVREGGYENRAEEVPVPTRGHRAKKMSF